MTINYQEYLNTQEWKNKKFQRLIIDNGVCQGIIFDKTTKRLVKCNSRKKLECHHKTYARLGSENVLTDLVTLCHSCHIKEHKHLKQRG